jgi:hypothetical protein
MSERHEQAEQQDCLPELNAQYRLFRCRFHCVRGQKT